MIKRKFGMAYLNISQGRYNAYSHKNNNAYDLCGVDSGIDKFVTFNDLLCLNFQSYKSTGFGNTVLYYDAENDVTLAFTHSNVTTWKVGQTYKSGEIVYYEGTTGRATGNHIHLEIGKGKQTKKTYFKDIKLWKLKDEINIEDYFYIDTAYTTIKQSQGYEFEMRQGETSEMSINTGYTKTTYNGVTIGIYTQEDNEDIEMISASGTPSNTARQLLQNIDVSDQKIYAKVNCNYFDLSSGEHYGVEQSYTLDNAVKSDKYLCVYVDNNNEVHYCKSSEYWLSKSDVKCAFTPFGVFVDNGQKVDEVSTAYTDKRKQQVYNTMFIQWNNGKYALAITLSASLTCYDLQEWAINKGASFMCILDGGASTQMRVYDKNSTSKNKMMNVRTNARQLANVLAFYQVENSTKNDDSEPNQYGGDNSTIEQLTAEIVELKAEIESEKELVNTYMNKCLALKDKLNQIEEILKGE